jgi:membrane-associated phospholipid phosphatase
MNCYDFLSFSTAFFPIIFLGKYFINKNLNYILAIAGLFIVNIISEFLKYKFFYSNTRPLGAKNCNLMNNDGDQSFKPGMPSSHSAITTFFVFTFLYLYYKETNTINPYITTLLFIYFYLVLLSRYKKLCHSKNQILAGFVLGFTSFVLFYKLV